MRLFPRQSAILGLTLSGIIFFAWSFHTLNHRTQYWNQLSTRLVVFGDSWSDNGEYVIDPPSKDLAFLRDLAQGRTWTEWLCLEISCRHQDNFARSLPYSWTRGHSGAVVDNSIFNRGTTPNASMAEPLADLKTQVAQWIRFEERQGYLASRTSEPVMKGTIFSVWFSLWDVWYDSQRSKEDSEKAIEDTINALFVQLDVLAKHWPLRVKIIMPKAVDPTFLPGWHATRTGPSGSDRTAIEQRSAVRLVAKWNSAIQERSATWENGHLYLYDTNEWIIEQIRDRQMEILNVAEKHDSDKSKSPWGNVTSPCVGNGDQKHPNATETDDGIVRCLDPQRYLFWDDLHLGPTALKMIGQGIAGDIIENRNGAWSMNSTAS